MENFVLYDEIGCGSMRTVYKGRRKGSVEYVAIHCIEKSKRPLVQNSVRVSYELEHRNIVRFYEWYETSNHLWLVVELCAGESLHRILEQDVYLPETTVKLFGKDLVFGLSYLHSLGIIYADLCASKLLLDSDGTLKFSNFCLSKLTDVTDSIEESNIKNPNETLVTSFYMAPELIMGGSPSRQSDLWALGCLLYEMYTGSPPFYAEDFKELCKKICDDKISYPLQGQGGTFKKASENLYMLIQGLLQKDPLQRIDWLELCLHPFWDNELNDLADSYDVRASRSIMSARSSRSDVNSGPDSHMTRDDVTNNKQTEQKQISRPDTVSKLQKLDKNKLQTQSLTIVPDEKQTVMSSVQSDVGIGGLVAQTQNEWKGTYKLERGLAVIDLTEIEGNEEKCVTPFEDGEEQSGVQYAKSRCDLKKKTPRDATSQSLSSEINLLGCSMNSVTSQGYSEIIPHLGGPDLNVLDHLYHPSDLIVSPIAENKSLLKLPVLKWDATLLGFSIIPNEKLQNSSKEAIMNYVEVIMTSYSQVGKSAPDKTVLRRKMHILAYLVAVVKMDEFANCVLCDVYMRPFLNDLKSSAHQDLKTRLGRLLSIVASNATYIDAAFNMSELFSVATDQLKQNFRSSQIKQMFLPVVGEFLFYAATQEESEDRVLQNWEPPGAAFTIITKCLQQHGDDNVTRLMSAKIIENLTSTTSRYCKKFLTNEVGLGLWNLYTHAASDIEKVTAASALCRVGMHSPLVIQHVSDRAGFDSFQVGAHTGKQRIQQAFVTMFVGILSSPTHGKRIVQDVKLLAKLVHNLESPSLILKGKLYLLLAEMCVRSHSVLLSCCEMRLITFIERDSRKVLSGREQKEALEYVHQCLTIIVNNIVKTSPRILEGIIHILEAASGRHHPNPAQVKQMKIHVPLFSIFLHMVTSSMFRKRISDQSFFVYIGKLLKLVLKIHNGDINLSGSATSSIAENLTTNVFSIIEAIAQHAPLLVENEEVFIEEVLPTLALFMKSDDGNTRMLCLKMFTDVSIFFLESENENESGLTARRDKSKLSLLKVIELRFFPEFESLLVDQDPFPAYCLKLLHACTEKSRDLLKLLLSRSTTMPMLFDILQTRQGDINSSVFQSSIGVLNNVLSDKEFDLIGLSNAGLFDILTSVFVDVASAIEDDVANVVSHLLLQLLDTLNHVLKNIETGVKKVLGKQQQQQQQQTSKQNVELLLKHGKVLSELNGILLNLLVYDDVDIQEWSCRCLYLCAELFGGGESEDCFTKDNLECMCIAIKTSSRKRQKLLLRIAKRFTTSSQKFKNIFTAPSLSFSEVISGLSVIECSDNDSRSIRNLSTELMQFFKK